MATRIEDYAMIGDCHTAALISKDGSIDWLCLPHFDSPACFAAMLGTKKNGHWCLSPTARINKIERRYRDHSMVLETDYFTDAGDVTVVDFMPTPNQQTDLCRIVIGRSGRVKMRMELRVRFDYGSIVPWVRHVGDNPDDPLSGGIRATAGPDTVYVRSTVPLKGENFSTVAEFEIKADHQVPFSCTWQQTHSCTDAMPPYIDPWQALKETEAWWREWSGKCTYQGRWRDQVLRSLVTLKAMTYAPSGGIVASVTTSLPEEIGGTRNWDYRYCWLRDATFTLMALDAGGYLDEAIAWRQWLINAIAGSPEDLQIMYGIDGRRRLDEMQLPWLDGYEGSKPVRIGNGAYTQQQLDTIGEVFDAMFNARKMGIPKHPDMWLLATHLLTILEKKWQEPDEGIWEIRGQRQHFVHSKVMAWVAFDRAVKSVEQFGQEGDVERWRVIRDQIHAEVCEKGFNKELNGFTQHYGSVHPDASTLMIPLVGFLPPEDPRVIGTAKLVQKVLEKDGYVWRYHTDSGVDGLPPGEGSFLLCSFWLADNLALIGEHDAAEKMFEQLLGLCNDVGLLAEGYDPKLGRMTGNFPQAFSHIGLINTARMLSSKRGCGEQRGNSQS